MPGYILSNSNSMMSLSYVPCNANRTTIWYVRINSPRGQCQQLFSAKKKKKNDGSMTKEEDIEVLDQCQDNVFPCNVVPMLHQNCSPGQCFRS